MTRQLLPVAVVTLGMWGCASAPRSYEFDRSFTAGASFDDTWAAVVDAVSASDRPPSSAEKASGLITTDWHDVQVIDRDRLIDCGGSGIGMHTDPQLRLNVTVREEGEGATRVTVNVSARTTFSLGLDEATRSTRQCNSRGVVEEQIRGAVLRQLEGRD